MGEAREPQEAEDIHEIMTVVQQDPTQYCKAIKKKLYLNLILFSHSQYLRILKKNVYNTVYLKFYYKE